MYVQLNKTFAEGEENVEKSHTSVAFDEVREYFGNYVEKFY